MQRLIKLCPSPAMLVALIALFVSLGGVGYAATQLKKNSVGTKQLKKSAVTADKVKDGTLGGADVADGSLTGADLGDGSVGLGDLADNSVNGAKVIDGSLGKDDVAAGTFLGGRVTVQSTTATADLLDNEKASYNAFCPAGQTAIGGGGRGDDQSSTETIVGSSRPAISEENIEPPVPGEGFTGWRLTVLNPTGGVNAGIRPTVWVICAALP